MPKHLTHYCGIALAACLCLIAVPCSAQQQRKNVLVLHSYHKAQWTDSLMSGIDSQLEQVPEVDLAVEYMDTKRVKSEAYYRALETVYRLKYHNAYVDAVLVSDDNAYQFALERQSSLFKQAPIVFCGVNRFDEQQLRDHPQVTGVVEKGDFHDTLDFALRARPNARTVNVIVDHTATGRINCENFLSVLLQYFPQLKVHFLTDLPIQTLTSELANLPSDDFAFFISYWLDGDNQPVSVENLSAALYKSSVPVFGRSEWMMAKGLTGGKCVSGFHQGEAAGRLVRRILSGENAADIPVNKDSPNRFMFDHELLVRYGIDPVLLPAGAILFNQPDPGFFRKYRGLILIVISIITTLTGLVFVLSVNIARRRQSEAATRASENRFRTVIENAADAIIMTDAKGNLVDVNLRACESLGYTREELLQCHFTDVDANFSSQKEIDQFWNLIRPGKPASVESNHRRKDGSTFPVQLRIGLLEIEGDTFMLALAYDITQRKKMEAELRESEARYRQLVQYAPAGIYEIDFRTMRFLSVNDVMCEYTGYTREEFLTLDPEVLLTEDSKPLLHAEISRLKPDTPAPPPMEYRVRARNGRIFWVLINARITFEKGRPAVALAVVHDLTELRKAEREKKELEAKLMQAHKMESLGTLAGGIAHDFNNLLMGVLGNASLMLMDQGRAQEDLDRLNHIESYVRRGMDLTRQLLGLSRGGKYEVKPTDLNKLVNESATMFSRTRKEVHFHHQSQNDIWAVACDKGQIDQVLLNIFINAWQAMPKGGDIYVATENVTLEDALARAHETTGGRFVKIAIKDTGIGMDQATIDKIFDPFFTTKERERGTGLGLASAYGIIKNHSGFIDVISQPGQGSTFNIYLPAVDKPIPAETTASGGIAYGEDHILLVDDEAMVRNVGKKMLERLGYQVTTAASGGKALALYQENRDTIDMVVLDMIMPDMSGAETFSNLQKIDPHIRVLLSSGYSIDGQATKILSQGCRGFIQKPFNVKELSRKIRDVLEG